LNWHTVPAGHREESPPQPTQMPTGDVLGKKQNRPGEQSAVL
jgi:hypothetical protein